MKILYLTYYFEPDLCAGSFRNTSLVKELSSLIKPDDCIHVVTTMPNRYKSYSKEALAFEKRKNIEINRIILPAHKSGFIDQAIAFFTFFKEALVLTKKRKYDLIFASSSRLFTAFLGRIISGRKNAPLYLDIRDIFVDTMQDVLKNKLIKHPFMSILKYFEKYTFSGATHINLISGGFESYFKRYHNASITFYSNGIDEEFLEIPVSTNLPDDKYLITYAGNIGEGQGLHKIIPEAAKMLGSKYHFRIIGDGGMRNILAKSLEGNNIKNVELLLPVGREKLKEFYSETHFLFIHLNDYQAFKKVLPSKIFEYGALDKPIIAGVAGYASDFIRKYIKNYILFLPGDATSLVNQLKFYKYKFEKRDEFRNTFERRQINILLAKSILSNIKKDY